MKMCNIYKRPFYLSPNTVDLWYRKPVSAETALDSCRGEREAKREAVLQAGTAVILNAVDLYCVT